MSVRVAGETVYLEGDCEVADAEILVAALETAQDVRVDVSQCRQLHGAVVQALLAFRPELIGVSPDQFLNEFVAPCLTRVPGFESKTSSNTDDGQGPR